MQNQTNTTKVHHT